MKITREEFKEYVNLYEEAWHNFIEYSDIIDSDFLDSLMFPMFNWMDKKIGIEEQNDWWDMWDIFRGRGIPVEWETIQTGENEYEIVNEVCTTDLDLIYDKWIKDNEE